MRIPPTAAAAVNSMLRNSNPLPRKTVAKNRSSSAPKRSRSTPINQRNAIPANGTKLSASAMVLELVRSHEPGSCGSAGTEIRRSEKAAIRRKENSIPAIAAAFGVRKFARNRYSFGMLARSLLYSRPARCCHGGKSGSLGQCGEEELAPGIEIILGKQIEQGLMARASLVQRHRKRVRKGRRNCFRIVWVHQKRRRQFRRCSRET